MICKNCGYENSDEALFCNKCGRSLIEEYKDDYDEYKKDKGQKSKTKTKTKSKSKTKTKTKRERGKKGKNKTRVVKEKNGRGSGLLIFLLILIILGLLAVLAFAGYKYYQKTYNIEVPNVVGLTYESAELKLAKKDLNITKKEVTVTDEKDAGVIIKQNKKEGSKVKKGAIIKVSVGVLDTSYRVPNFVGEEIEDAIKTLTKEKVSYNIVYEESDEDENTVIKQSITKYTKMDKSETITLTVSKEKEQVSSQNETTKESQTKEKELEEVSGEYKD